MKYHVMRTVVGDTCVYEAYEPQGAETHGCSADFTPTGELAAWSAPDTIRYGLVGTQENATEAREAAWARAHAIIAQAFPEATTGARHGCRVHCKGPPALDEARRAVLHARAALAAAERQYHAFSTAIAIEVLP